MTPGAWMLAILLVYPNGKEVTVQGGFAKTYQDCRAFGAQEVELLKLHPLYGAKPKFTCKPAYEVR